MPLISFDTPWKHQKTSGFLMFSGDIESPPAAWNELKKVTGQCQVTGKQGKIWYVDTISFFNLWKNVKKIWLPKFIRKNLIYQNKQP